MHNVYCIYVYECILFSFSDSKHVCCLWIIYTSTNYHFKRVLLVGLQVYCTLHKAQKYLKVRIL